MFQGLNYIVYICSLVIIDFIGGFLFAFPSPPPPKDVKKISLFSLIFRFYTLIYSSSYCHDLKNIYIITIFFSSRSIWLLFLNHCLWFDCQNKTAIQNFFPVHITLMSIDLFSVCFADGINIIVVTSWHPPLWILPLFCSNFSAELPLDDINLILAWILALTKLMVD